MERVRCIIKINNITKSDADIIINSLEPDNVDAGDKIIIKHQYIGDTLIYIIENSKTVSSGMYTINDIVRSLNIVLKLIGVGR